MQKSTLMLLKRLKNLWKLSALESKPSTYRYLEQISSMDEWNKQEFENLIGNQMAQFIKPSSKDVISEITNEH